MENVRRDSEVRSMDEVPGLFKAEREERRGHEGTFSMF